MSERNFNALLQAKWDGGKFVCVGLDSKYAKIPQYMRSVGGGVKNTIFKFNQMIVEATKDIVCCYKPNIAFYEGDQGKRALYDTINFIHDTAPTVPVILDVKQGDIDNTNDGYVVDDFDWYDADAITVHNYMGMQAMEPFLSQKDKGIFPLCRTSNKGADEFQNLMLANGERLYQKVARNVAGAWNKNGNCGLVVGATCPEELQLVRHIVGDMPILIPGIGAQGGDLERTVLAGKNSKNQGMIINSSRAIIFASNGPDFAEAARLETQRLHDSITKVPKGEQRNG